jgi:hypothetical protein
MCSCSTMMSWSRIWWGVELRTSENACAILGTDLDRHLNYNLVLTMPFTTLYHQHQHILSLPPLYVHVLYDAGPHNCGPRALPYTFVSVNKPHSGAKGIVRFPCWDGLISPPVRIGSLAYFDHRYSETISTLGNSCPRLVRRSQSANLTPLISTARS